MSQHDFNIANQTASATRVDLNNALGALASLSSGTTAPTTTFANMLWYETSTNWLWVRNEADSAWIRFAYFDQATGIASVLDDTKVVNTSGTQTGLLGDQSTATWQAGTGTTQSLVSPANVKAAVLALAPLNGVGVGQTWTNVLASRTTGVVYTNTTGKPIMVNVFADGVGDTNVTIYPAAGGSLVIDRISNEGASTSFIVPHGDGYMLSASINPLAWSELR